jgi:hypothetical protein
VSAYYSTTYKCIQGLKLTYGAWAGPKHLNKLSACACLPRLVGAGKGCLLRSLGSGALASAAHPAARRCKTGRRIPPPPPKLETWTGYSDAALLGQEDGLFSRDLVLSEGELINKVQIKASE